MPSMRSWTKIVCVTAACCALFGCGKASDSAPALNSKGEHPENWITEHRAAYRNNKDFCRGCHGTDLMGGITKISCSTNGCHQGDHPPRDIIHALPFKNPTLHGSMAKKDLTICKDCHGEAKGAGGNPRFNLAIGALSTGCEASGCHQSKMAHPKPWKTHGLSGNQANACALCHGAHFEGGGVGRPSCKSCHTQLSFGLIPVVGQCASCHGNPPNGTVSPNTAGSHAAHISLPGMSGNCNACHSGGGSGTVNHSVTPTLSFAPGLSASGSTAFNGTTCATMSCHGGVVTPAWQGGNIDVVTECIKCHQAGTTEYISYDSGKHAEHVGKGVACTDCHDMSNAQTHFKDVSTQILETKANTTLRGYLNYNIGNSGAVPPVPPSCMVSNQPPSGVQFAGCHSGSKDWKK